MAQAAELAATVDKPVLSYVVNKPALDLSVVLYGLDVELAKAEDFDVEEFSVV